MRCNTCPCLRNKLVLSYHFISCIVEKAANDLLKRLLVQLAHCMLLEGWKRLGMIRWNIVRQPQHFPWSCVACAAETVSGDVYDYGNGYGSWWTVGLISKVQACRVQGRSTRPAGQQGRNARRHFKAKSRFSCMVDYLRPE